MIEWILLAVILTAAFVYFIARWWADRSKRILQKRYDSMTEKEKEDLKVNVDKDLDITKNQNIQDGKKRTKRSGKRTGNPKGAE